MILFPSLAAADTLSREKPHNEFLQQALPLKSLTSPFLCRMQSDDLQSMELAVSHACLMHLFALSVCTKCPRQSPGCRSQAEGKVC